MRVHERLFAHLDDIWLVSKPDRVGDLHNSAERELWGRARIRIHSGKTHVWNRSGRKPPACDELQRRAEMLDEEARVWTGSEIPSIQHLVGVPSGSRGFRVAKTHDARVWQCLCDILKIPEDCVGNLHKEAATVPLSLGGLGLRSAVRTSVPAHWASWADVLPMIRDRHPVVATTIVNALPQCGEPGSARS